LQDILEKKEGWNWFGGISSGTTWNETLGHIATSATIASGLKAPDMPNPGDYIHW
jgi:hypothetical protein